MQKPIHDPAAVASYYHIGHTPAAGSACRGFACFAARREAPNRWIQACDQPVTVYCLGQCHAAPAVAGQETRPQVRCYTATPTLLANVLDGGVRRLDRYLRRDGGMALRQAISMKSNTIIETIAASGLRGRGGAGFPAGRKWQAVRDVGAPPVIVVNADEGDPGAFSDKVLIEEDPFLLIEAIGIAAHALHASRAIIYLRCEYPAAARVLTDALAEANAANWPGNVSIELHIGYGSFVCGEETSLLNALEGKRPFARSRPPYPVQRGLHAQPTLVHNVETLCSVVWIVQHGAEAYRQLGTPASAGTKLLSLNSLFRQPGLVEVPFGLTLRQIVEDIGGGIRRGKLLGTMIGGPLAGLLPPSTFETPFTYEDLVAIGGAVGHGGVIAFADDTTIAELMCEVFRFGATESCGLCVPCRGGTAELWEAFDASATEVRSISRERWDELLAALEETSLCGHGSGLAEFARSIERYYPRELAACLR